MLEPVPVKLEECQNCILVDAFFPNCIVPSEIIRNPLNHGEDFFPILYQSSGKRVAKYLTNISPNEHLTWMNSLMTKEKVLILLHKATNMRVKGCCCWKKFCSMETFYARA